MVNLLPKESRNAAFNLLTEAKARALKEQPLYPIETEAKESKVTSSSPSPKEVISTIDSVKVDDLRANFEDKIHKPTKPVIPSKPKNLTITTNHEPIPIENLETPAIQEEVKAPAVDPILEALNLEKREAQTKYDDSRVNSKSLTKI